MDVLDTNVTFGRKIGTNGETKMRVIVDEKKNKIVTSFPEI